MSEREQFLAVQVADLTDQAQAHAREIRRLKRALNEDPAA
jgi:hypothetical protein